MKSLHFLTFFFVVFKMAAGGPANSQIVQLNTINSAQIKWLAEMEPAVTHLILNGQCSEHQLKQLLKGFVDGNSLTSIEFKNANFESLPDVIQEISSLQMLAIRGNLQIDLDETLSVLEKMHGLRSLEIEVAALEDLPHGLFEMDQLDRLVLHEHLLDGEEEAAECIAVEIDMQKDDRPVSTIKAYVYVSLATWNKMQDVDVLNGLRKLKPCAPVVRKYAHVEPPIEMQDIQSTTVTIDPNVQSSFVAGQGKSIIRVPADAFVHANGAKVNGSVTISYREFTKPAEFIASGIPMSFEMDSTTYYYESAGMVEINASSEGEEVFLAVDKSIDVLLGVGDDKGEMDVWSFDDSKGIWKDVGNSSPATVQQTVGFTGVSQAVQMYYRSMVLPINKYDTTAFENRFKSPFYYHSSAARGKRVISSNDSQKMKKRNTPSRSTGMRVRSVRRRKDGEAYFRFVGNRFLHPELRYLRADCWRLDDAMATSDFKANFARRHRYSDMRMVERDHQYFLVLKENGAIKEVAVTPMKRIEDKEGVRYTEHQWSLKDYNKSVIKRGSRFDKSNKRKYDRQASRISVLEKRMQGQITKLMSIEEKAMGWEAFLEYARAQNNAYMAQFTRAQVLSDKVNRILSVNNLGLCNIDRLKQVPYRETVGIEILVDSQAVLINNMYVTITGVNTVLNVNVNPSRVTQQVMVFGENTGSLLFITAEERIGIVPREVFLAAFNSKKGIVSIETSLLPIDTKLENIDL